MTTEITVQRIGGTWVIRADGAVFAETGNAVELLETGHQPVVYFPRADVGMDFFELSSQETTCPHKGAANYYDLAAESGIISNVAWSYENPKPMVSEIAGHLAFDPERVTIEQV